MGKQRWRWRGLKPKKGGGDWSLLHPIGLPRPGSTEGHCKAVPPHPQITTCASPNENCAPQSKDCAPKKVTGLVPLECSSMPEIPQNTGHHPRICEQGLFFRRFCNKDLFLAFTPEFAKFRAYFAMKTFGFWSTLLNSKEKSFYALSEIVYAPPVTLLWCRAWACRPKCRIRKIPRY